TQNTTLARFFAHEPPYSDDELQQGALELLRDAARQRTGLTLEAFIGHTAPFTTFERKRVAKLVGLEELVLENYIPYVQPKFNLGVRTRMPGWIFFLPLAMWLMW